MEKLAITQRHTYRHIRVYISRYFSRCEHQMLNAKGAMFITQASFCAIGCRNKPARPHARLGDANIVIHIVGGTASDYNDASNIFITQCKHMLYNRESNIAYMYSIGEAVRSTVARRYRCSQHSQGNIDTCSYRWPVHMHNSHTNHRVHLSGDASIHVM